MKLWLDVGKLKALILQKILQKVNVYTNDYEIDKKETLERLKSSINDFKQAYPDFSSTESSMNVMSITEEIMKKAIEYTPYKTGKLINSINLLVDRNQFNGELAYCIEYKCDYAVYVHEIAQNKHDKGRYKFLESAAFDVIGEHNNELGWYISIEYNPLRLYINYPNRGVPLNQIQRNLDYMNSEAFDNFMDKMMEVRGKGILPDHWLNAFMENYFSKYDLDRTNTEETKKNFIDRIRSFMRY